jgi:hypothetical protein
MIGLGDLRSAIHPAVRLGLARIEELAAAPSTSTLAK